MTPLRRLLARHLLGILLPLLAIMLGLVWWGSRSLLLSLAHRDGEARLRIAVQALDRRLTTVERAGGFISSYWEQGRLPFDDTEASAALLMPWVLRQDEVGVVNLLDEAGRSLLLIQGNNRWRAREIRLDPEGRRLLRWQDAGAEGIEPPYASFDHFPTYDARRRPWYQEARLLQAPRWSTPYRLDPPESRLVMTWLTPLRETSGQLVGALGLDILPQDLHAFLGLLRPTSGSRLWVLDHGNTILASAHGAQAEVPAPLAGDRTELAGQTFQVLRSDVPVHPGTQWRMVLAIPERDLLAAAQARILGLTAVAFILLTLPLLWGLRVGRQLADEVQVLAKAADRLGAGELPDLPFQQVTEFHTVAQALRRAHAEIQEQARMQQRLQHGQRMETLGTLAGGIAHDVNNHLNAIMGQLFLARESLPEGHLSSQRMAQAEDVARRCAKVTRALLTFSRHGKPELAPLDLNDLVAGTAEVLEHVLGGLVLVELDLASDLPQVLGDPLQLEQVIMNLAVNARDSMADGGRLLFRTRLGQDRAVELSVTDSGAGIAAEDLQRIYEPFFTTKPVGQGTGLGLAMVLGIVQNHGGRIEVESELGKGTTFTLTFPAAPEEAPEPATPTAALLPKFPLQGLRILVAEDEIYLKDTLEEALTVAGAEVVTAASGESAWQRFQNQAFDCVLSDQRMPGCTGLELLERIRTTGSTVPFILASGQDLEPFQSESDRDARLRLLAKPFSVTQLVALMRELGVATN